MSTLDARIDELYALPLAEFTASRNALAKTLKGEDAARVKRLEKPAQVAWAVNQLYWRERRTYDRLMGAGRALRAAQIGALKGRANDVRGAGTEHRAAVAAAVATANQIVAQSGARPSAEPLSRMLEALSLAAEPPATPGRFTNLVQPAGFEALSGIAPVARPQAPPSPQHRDSKHRDSKGRPDAIGPPAQPAKTSRTEALEERRRAAAAAAARKAAESAAHAARRILEQAQAAEAQARQRADTAREQLRRTESALAEAREAVTRAAAALAQAEAALARL